MAVSTSTDEGDVLSEINITPLVDVMLVLLVAFVITIPALTNAIHVNLPRTVQTTPPEQQKAITVTVDTAGTIYFDDVVVPIAELETRLAQIKASTAEPAGWYDRLVNGDKAGVLFRCDDPDQNCATQDGK